MAKKATKSRAKPKAKRKTKASVEVKARAVLREAQPKRSLRRRVRCFFVRSFAAIFLAMIFPVVLFALINPPINIYMFSEGRRLGGVEQEWVDIDNIAPVMVRSVVAAEDANFCRHWGFDLVAIRQAIAQGANRGASTLTQQTVKNVYLWHGRSWVRKGLETAWTPLVETIWSKRRILEVYLNIAEFDEGVFGIKAAAKHYFGVSPDKLSPTQAASLAAVLPAPKQRSASRPSKFLRKRASQIRSGAETIRADGRAACFES